MTQIQINQLTVKHTGRKAPTLVDVNLAINQGETVLLLGASGCGKSTLALTLNGLIPHSVGGELRGQVIVAGLDTQHHPVSDLARQTGIVFQDPEAQFVTLKVEDELVFGLENLCIPPEQMDAPVAAALAAVNLTALRQRPVQSLSGGEKQRIALAALLVMAPPILVFDEPTAHLDPMGTQEVFALIAVLKAKGEHTILLIEHKLDELMHLIDRVVVLGEQGAILADGAPHIVFAEQYDLLCRQGVWLPQVVRLAQQLRNQAASLTRIPVTLAEAATLLRAQLGDRPAIVADHATSAKPAGPLAIDVRHLSFSYGSQPILEDVSLTAPRGDFLAIVGANGAGKTTLAQHLAGILAPPPGTVLIHGQDLLRLSAHERSRQVGYVFQNPEHQFVTGSVADEIRFGLRVLGLAEAEVMRQADDLLARFDLARYARANPFTLSHGEKRRLSVATMLAMGQEILVLDEPTFGQDQRNAAELLDLLRQLHEDGRTVIIITHDMTLVADYAQHMAVMSQGKLLAQDETRTLFGQPDLLAKARLNLPPLAQVARQAGLMSQPGRALLTVDDFVATYSRS